MVVAVVVAVQGEFGAGYQGDGIKVANIGLADLFQATGVVGSVVARFYLALDIFQDGQHDEAEGGQALLAVYDVKLFVVFALQDEVTHVMRAFFFVAQDGQYVCPQVFPLFDIPTVIALEAGDTVGQAIADQFAEGVVFGFEVGRCHVSSSIEFPSDSEEFFFGHFLFQLRL